MDKVSTYECIRLAELPAVGPKSISRILAVNRLRSRTLGQFFGLPEQVYRDEYHLPAQAVACLCERDAAYAVRCQELADRLAEHGGTALLAGTPGYPTALEHYLTAPPPIVFALGDSGLLTAPAAAVLNSRTPSCEAIVATQTIVRATARQGFAIASGAMKPGHRVAAASARAAGAPRIIVLDRGLFAAMGDATERDTFGLISGHLRLDRSRTLVLSSFRLTNHAAPANGARRDSLIAALADLVIAVEATPGGHMEQLGLHMVARGKVVVSWRAQNATLLAAGARPLNEQDLANGLAPLVSEGSRVTTRGASACASPTRRRRRGAGSLPRRPRISGGVSA